MTTVRDTQPPYQTTASAGGKLRKAPLQRRNIPCAPAIMKKNPNLLTKIVDRASKLFRVVFGNRNPSGVMDRHDDVVFMIHYNGVFKYDPLRYEQFRVVEACTTDRVMFSPLLDMLVAKLKNNIWALFLCILGLDIDSSGMKLIKNDANVHGLYDLTEKHVTELVVWAEDEANYPYFRSPPLKSRPWLGMDGATSDTIEETKPFHASLPAINHKVCVKASGFGFGSFCKCKKTVECVACLLRRWNRSRGREVQTEIALDVAREEVVGLGKGRDGNEHVQRMLNVICVINNKKGLKEDSRCDRGRGLGTTGGALRDHQITGVNVENLMGHVRACRKVAVVVVVVYTMTVSCCSRNSAGNSVEVVVLVAVVVVVVVVIVVVIEHMVVCECQVPVLELEPEQLELELELEQVQIEIALDVAREEVVGVGKGQDGNEHVQWMLHGICVINNKKGLKEDSRCDRGEGRVFGNGLEREREPWKRLRSRSSRLQG
ncbi:hypothetical protein Tco_0814674 [Tanacetum coccineum]